MNWRPNIKLPQLPLLTRELTEQAARLRTYLLRVGYACLSFVAAFVMFSGIFFRSGNNPFEVLGQGREVYQTVFKLQFWGIVLFMPALTAGSISQEKERNCLEVLLLTRLSPWTIVWEKLLARLVPMLTFLLLSLPLMAFAYTLGGVSQLEFWCGIVALLLFAAQVGAVAVMCSAYCRTTIGAFAGTYAVILLSALCCCSSSGGFWMDSSASPNEESSLMVGAMFASIVVTVPAMLFAANFLVVRANLRPTNPLLKSFREMDSVFESWNRLTGNIVLIKDDTSLPNLKPIAWRETTKKSLGTVRYLFRVLITIIIPLLAVLVWVAGERFQSQTPFAGILMFVWIVTVPIVAVKSATAISGERSAQTLDVLLTTPLSGAEIIRQKCSGIRRLIVVMSIPLLTTVGFEIYWDWTMHRLNNTYIFMYTIAAVGSILLYLQLVAWIAFRIGLAIRSQVRAIVFVLALLFGWMFLPAFIDPNSGSHRFSDVFLNAFTQASVHPTTLVIQNEQRSLTPLSLGTNFVFWGFVTLGLRFSTLMSADRLLGRADSRGSFSRDQTEPEPAA